MFDIVRRRNYDARRVLIDSSRVLDPQFDDSLLYLTGAELELLRNVTLYLRRQDTYVANYYAGHYLTPDVEDWDALQAIVAGLEETLMGNPNTIWGYYQTIRDDKSLIDASAGTHYLSSTAIPEGKVAKLEGFAFKNADSVCSRVGVYLKDGSDVYALVDIASPAAGVWHTYSIERSMHEGEVVLFAFEGVVALDDLYWQVEGYLMVLP